MKIPTHEQAEAFMNDAQRKNPGAWVEHSRYVARAAEAIAAHHPALDPEAAFILGYLHDIGRCNGVSGMRHVMDGYNFLIEKGFDEAARICLTHSYPIKDARTAPAKWDGSVEDQNFVSGYLAKVEYDDYDKLIQLCDSLALPTGFCLMETRLMDVALRYGTNEFSVPRWKAYLGLQKEFEKVTGRNIYTLLPGVIENTFGFTA